MMMSMDWAETHTHITTSPTPVYPEDGGSDNGGGNGTFLIPFYDNMTLEDLLRQMKNQHNYTDDYDMWKKEWDILQDELWKVVVVVIYVLVIVFGCLANVLVVVVILRYRQLHTVTNVFIVALGLADIALCLFNLPLQLHYQLNDHWAFGAGLCSAAMATFGVPMFASSLFILMIAVDRYLLIVYPFKKRMTVRCAILLVALIVAVTVAMAVPLMVYTHLVIIEEKLVKMHKVYCTEVWPSLGPKQVYSVTCFLLQFVLPLIFTTIFYAHICHVLRNRPIKKHDTRRNQRTNRILIAVVLTFTVCWLPWNLFVMTAEFNHQLVKGRYFRFTDLLLKIFAMGSACVNPFLYGWLNDNFKKELGKMLGYNALCCKQSRRLRGDNLSMGYFSKATNMANNTVYQPAAMPLNGAPSPNSPA
ncbi:prolactin-releasing peptide receptor-like [Babylonia areolata]|uniref:prolactin-releasing peptide receptor-like n=1 Tax=Babylonia areolata TaxID=304850 RepID=UPI003FCF628D